MNQDFDAVGFWPPFCPNVGCEQAVVARRGGFFRHGYYSTRVYGRRIPRFLCRSCRRTMSSQTFDETYRLRMPGLQSAILEEIARGSSLRHVAQVLRINRKTVSRRLKRVSQQRIESAPQAIPAVAERPAARSKKRGAVRTAG